MLPQFDLTFFPSQIFWLIVCFGVFFAFVHFVFFPRMQQMFLNREMKIKKDIKTYEHNIHEIREIEKTHAHMLKTARTEAEEVQKQATLKAKEFAAEQCAEIDKTLNAKFEVAKAELETEVKKMEASLKEEVLKSASILLEKLEGEKPDLDELKKLVS